MEIQKIDGLTHRETEVAMLAGYGATDKEISIHLRISIATTKNHVKNIYKKLEVHTRGALVAKINQNFELHESLKNLLENNHAKLDRIILEKIKSS
jgi:DNA-binding CsgD family transcriptional regulator